MQQRLEEEDDKVDAAIGYLQQEGILQAIESETSAYMRVNIKNDTKIACMIELLCKKLHQLIKEPATHH